MAIFLPLHVSESFPYSRRRLWLGVCVCQASMPSCMCCLCGFWLFLGVSASWSLRLFVCCSHYLECPFPRHPLAHPPPFFFNTFFSAKI